MECTHEGGIEASFLEQNAPDLCQSTGFSLSKGLRIQCRPTHTWPHGEKKKKYSTQSDSESVTHIMIRGSHSNVILKE